MFYCRVDFCGHWILCEPHPPCSFLSLVTLNAFRHWSRAFRLVCGLVTTASLSIWLWNWTRQRRTNPLEHFASHRAFKPKVLSRILHLLTVTRKTHDTYDTENDKSTTLCGGLTLKCAELPTYCELCLSCIFFNCL